MDRFLLDLRQSLRTLRRSKGLLLGAALTLALGIGATTTLFSIVHGGTRQLPFAQPHELVVMTQTDQRSGRTDLRVHDFDYAAWSTQQTSFEGLAAFRAGAVNIADAGLRPERRNAASITASAFALIGATAARGRLFNDADAAADAPAVAIIADDLWRARYNADPNILGRSVRINGVPHTVVGVMPSGFGFPVSEQLWVPLRIDVAAQPGAGQQFVVFGRLRDGVSLERARTELNTIGVRLARAHPGTHAERGIHAIPFVDMEMDPEVLPVLYLMLFAVSFVLVIACANVANLLLARAATRTRDVAIRTALGASRRRLITQQLIESLALAIVGGAGGVLLAHVGVRFFDAATADIINAFWIDFRVDRVVLGFATSLVALAGIGAGILPALRASATPPASLLKDASGASGLRIGRLSRGLVIAELALVCGLLGVSGSFVKASLGLRAIELPFDARSIFTASLTFSNARMDDSTYRSRVLRELTTQLQATAGIQGAALASTLPARGGGINTFTLDGVAESSYETGVVATTPGYLEVLNGRVLQGRDLNWADDVGAPLVAVVNESWVRRYSADRAAIGRTLTFPWPTVPGRATPQVPPVTIVGIVPDLQIQDPDEARGDGVYLALLQEPYYGTHLIVRTAGDPLTLAPLVRERVEAIDPDLPVFDIATLHDAIYSEASVLDAFGVLFAAFGGGALFLAIVGVYGVVAFGVTQRTREFGVRIALGAQRADILSLVVRQGGRSVLIGSAIGLMLAVGLHRALVALIDVIQPGDLAIIGGVIGVLVVTAVTALLVPARRAAATEPLLALRQD